MKTFKKTYGKKEKPSRHQNKDLTTSMHKDETTFFHDACESAKINRIRVQCGKGDKPRNCFSQEYKDNYDSINWGN